MENDLKSKVSVKQLDGELAPFEIDPESAEKMGYEDQLPDEGMQPQKAEDGPEPETAATVIFVNDTSVRRWLGIMFRAGYVANSILDKDSDKNTHEHWIATEEELDFVTPLMTEWINERPQIAKAVHDLETTGAPAILAGMFAFRQIKSIRIRQKRRQEQDGEPFAASEQTDTRTSPSTI